ncbi:MAG: TetR/AcrR family transcriptional regulator [Idiomarina sp.]
MAARISTKDKILNAAEALFAEHGFEQTSLRQITADANVNLASVNYHFGSKKALIQAVIARYSSLFMPGLDAKLKQLQSHPQISTREVFDCFREPLRDLVHINKRGPAIYLSLLGYAYAEIQGHLRRFTMQEYGDVILRLVTLLHAANPQLTAEDVFWRLHFVLGATVFAQVSSQALQEIAKADFNSDVSAEDIIDKLIPFIAGGLDAPHENEI